MIIFKQADQLSAYIINQKNTGKRVGFVPTMGALHEGHLSLVKESKQENDLTVCSIFINPTQFNNQEDFNKYPKTIEKDIELLTRATCDILFIPVKDQIYPESFTARHFDIGYLENILEGLHRPGHFQGVCQVVDLLLNIVQPDGMYLGQKDYQQCMVIAKLIELRGTGEKLYFVQTKREADGLAMSSRNLRLDATQRKLAASISEVLNYLKDNISSYSLAVLQQNGRLVLQEKGFTVDYVAICDAHTLLEATSTDKPIIALIAASLDSIRLIDNMRLN